MSSTTRSLRSTIRRGPHVLAGISLASISLFGFVACSGGEEGASGGADGSSSGEKGETGEAATLPQQAAAPTAPGATSFVTHWVTVLNDASNSGETDAWRSLAQPDCRACNGLADGIDALYDDGGSLTTDGWKVLRTSVTLRPQGVTGARVTGAEVRLRVNRLPEAVHADAESQAEVFRGGEQVYAVMLVRVDGAWSVRSFSPVRRRG